jgi:hypothetical protein
MDSAADDKLSRYDVTRMSLYTDGVSDNGVSFSAGHVQRTALVPFDHNAQPMKVNVETLDTMPVDGSTKYHRVSNMPRMAGDPKLARGVGIISTQEDGVWGPSVLRPRGALKATAEVSVAVSSGGCPGKSAMAGLPFLAKKPSLWFWFLTGMVCWYVVVWMYTAGASFSMRYRPQQAEMAFYLDMCRA